MSAYQMWELACMMMPFHPYCHRRKKPSFANGAEIVVLDLPFCRLIRFVRSLVLPRQRVIVVAPMSGHHATLLRHVVADLSKTYDVYVTDWRCASQVPLREGEFGLDSNIEYIQEFLKVVPDAHVVCVSQSCIATLAAVALMAAVGRRSPRTLSLLGGPVDIECGPTKLTHTIASTSLDWFEARMGQVSSLWPGVGRDVWPALAQYTAFLVDRPIEATHVASREDLETFYDEYYAVVDLPWKYFKEVIECVFHKRSLATGSEVNGRRVDLRLIRETALLTVEGIFDETVGQGQCSAALALCSGVPEQKKSKVVVPANHYSMIYGLPWSQVVLPELLSFMRKHEG